ncbi:transmembrane and ubiquitin-like domain-containing protein 2 isoform X2 [Bombina bombina]|nr:transmembrane and ubiquitin-like domain-containing protein 2 isoform X2 [Bombina bombina]XP_053556030.1 transmembrane and ubiquitin-like domain-containing protein 2 isoform X2 [Bombina bombina]
MGMESPPPTMIEGLGDEVTVAVGLFVLLLALTLAWLSTYVAEGSDPFLGSLMPPVRRDPLLGLSNPVPPTPEPQGPTQPPVEKPEEGERDSGLEQGEGSENANLDQMLDIQGVPKRSQSIPALQEENNAGQELSQEVGRGPENIQDATRIEEHLLDDSRECETLESKQQVEKNVKEIGCIKKEGKRQEEGLISVRLKFLNETEEIAFMRPDDTIGSLKSKYFPGQELQMKLIFQGQLLHDSSQTLRSLHIKDNCVIHCHRSQATAPSSPARPESGGTTPENAGLTTPIGNLMIPLFVIMLALIWYFRINYRQFFTAPATVSLVGVTVFFSFLVFGMYGR